MRRVTLAAQLAEKHRGEAAAAVPEAPPEPAATRTLLSFGGGPPKPKPVVVVSAAVQEPQALGGELLSPVGARLEVSRLRCEGQGS